MKMKNYKEYLLSTGNKLIFDGRIIQAGQAYEDAEKTLRAYEQ